MAGLLRHSAATLALVLFAVALVGGPALADGELPDLKIEVVELSPPKTVRLRVTNIGDAWADNTKARIETVPPSAGTPSETDVDNLDPGQSFSFTYTLEAACDGHALKVKASVSTAVDYKGDKETKTANNRAERDVCQASAQAPIERGIITKPPGADGRNVEAPPVPEQLRPGVDKVLTRDSSVVKHAQMGRTSGLACADLRPVPDLRVGFAHLDGPACQMNLVFMALLAFDFSDFAPIYGIQKLLIGSATLSWTVGGNEMNPPNSYRSCVVNLSVPIEDWNVSDRFINTEPHADDPDGLSEWDARRLVQLWMSDSVAARRGVMLRGPDERLDADDDARCQTVIEAPKLRMVYTVLR